MVLILVIKCGDGLICNYWDFIAWYKEALACTDALQAPFLVPGEWH